MIYSINCFWNTLIIFWGIPVVTRMVSYKSCSDRLEDRDQSITYSRSLRKDRIEIERAGIENHTYESQSKLLSFSLIFQTTRLFTWCWSFDVVTLRLVNSALCVYKVLAGIRYYLLINIRYYSFCCCTVCLSSWPLNGDRSA